jgi:hypothetical protein
MSENFLLAKKNNNNKNNFIKQNFDFRYPFPRHQHFVCFFVALSVVWFPPANRRGIQQ